jgi:UDP-N-acetyl-D-glucosamine dehydrogenase
MELKQRVLNRSARVAVKGVGYVGFPLAVAFAEAGFAVVVIDVDEGRVEAINAGHSYIVNIPSEWLARLVSCEPEPLGKARRLWATSDDTVLDHCVDTRNVTAHIGQSSVRIVKL